MNFQKKNTNEELLEKSFLKFRKNPLNSAEISRYILEGIAEGNSKGKRVGISERITEAINPKLRLN